MTVPVVVMAAGLGTRLRPFTEFVAKPLLPVDGRPVLGTLLHELAGAGVREVVVVVGHLSEQLEGLVGDGGRFGVGARVVRQQAPDGSADAVRTAGLEPPYAVTAADTVYGRGDFARFLEAAAARPGAIAVRRSHRKHAIAVDEDLRVVRVVDRGGAGPWTGAPLWLVGRPVHERLCLDGKPYELGNAFQRAIDDGHEVFAVPIGGTRDLTEPLDLLRENFPYLRAIT